MSTKFPNERESSILYYLKKRITDVDHNYSENSFFEWPGDLEQALCISSHHLILKEDSLTYPNFLHELLPDDLPKEKFLQHHWDFEDFLISALFFLLEPLPTDYSFFNQAFLPFFGALVNPIFGPKLKDTILKNNFLLGYTRGMRFRLGLYLQEDNLYCIFALFANKFENLPRSVKEEGLSRFLEIFEIEPKQAREFIDLVENTKEYYYGYGELLQEKCESLETKLDPLEEISRNLSKSASFCFQDFVNLLDKLHPLERKDFYKLFKETNQ